MVASIGAMCFGLFFFYYFNFLYNPLGNDGNGDSDSEPKLSVKNISLTIDYRNGEKKNEENFSLSEGKTTVFDALNEWCDIKYKDYVYDVFITEIDGVSGDWLYWVNDDFAEVGCKNYNLKDGDTILWNKTA